jgi:hypothetical protein
LPCLRNREIYVDLGRGHGRNPIDGIVQETILHGEDLLAVRTSSVKATSTTEVHVYAATALIVHAVIGGVKAVSGRQHETITHVRGTAGSGAALIVVDGAPDGIQKASVSGRNIGTVSGYWYQIVVINDDTIAEGSKVLVAERSFIASQSRFVDIGVVVG